MTRFRFDSKVLEDLASLARKHPDIVLINVNQRDYTPRDIVKNVKAGTELGKQLYIAYQLGASNVEGVKRGNPFF